MNFYANLRIKDFKVLGIDCNPKANLSRIQKDAIAPGVQNVPGAHDSLDAFDAHSVRSTHNTAALWRLQHTHSACSVTSLAPVALLKHFVLTCF